MSRVRKKTEYMVHERSGNVFIVGLDEARRTAENPSDDIVLIEKVTRWVSHVPLDAQVEEVLFEREGYEEAEDENSVYIN